MSPSNIVKRSIYIFLYFLPFPLIYDLNSLQKFLVIHINSREITFDPMKHLWVKVFYINIGWCSKVQQGAAVCIVTLHLNPS